MTKNQVLYPKWAMPEKTIEDFFKRIEDHRHHNKLHKLIDVIIIAICGVIAGADTYEQIENFGKKRKKWLSGFLELPHGIPSHDTFGIIFQGNENMKKEGFLFDEYKTVDGDHGRIETRKYVMTSDIDWLYDKENWAGLKSLGMVESIRDIKGECSYEKRYYISSLDCDAKKFGDAVRSHWGIENSVHWVLKAG